jgi:hypothetical protein
MWSIRAMPAGLMRSGSCWSLITDLLEMGTSLFRDAPSSLLIFSEPSEANQGRLDVSGECLHGNAETACKNIHLHRVIKKKSKVLTITTLKAAGIDPISAAGFLQMLMRDQGLAFGTACTATAFKNIKCLASN